MKNINKATPDDSEYLQILAGIDNKPKALYYIGTLPAERRPTVSIVGSRKPTAYGREVGYKLAYELAARGVVIVSGLAIGIDSTAHQAALDAGGTTLAVLGNGLAEIYPATNEQLAKDIVNHGGAIISEYEPTMPGMRHQFLERNRIVSGLCDVLLVVEAAARSGTLSTANHALGQGKDVAAIPGNITSPMSAGCNKLIKQGAMPITEVGDILQLLGLTSPRQQLVMPLADTPEEAILLQLLQKGVRDGEELHKKSRLTAALFGQTLSMLEITGKIEALGANQWTLS
ncbi:MAG TPA: DNA-processing protein DprA [Candidatus Saccharimonadales bacterium]|jgi:DNA processing protein|nr:DNA-processing protein DprA [Candidatus Saccharimonadales bacterium]